MASTKTPEQYLFETFGFDSFRGSQKVIIETVAYKKTDVCCIMATGHGKSLCYQLPALITGKPSVIISPLLSLMEDQSTNLAKVGVKACCYNSTLKDKTKAYNDILAGEYQIIYITPETIVNSQNLLTNLNENIGISLIAIDEAHCVSLWGNSFRSSYLQLSCLKTWLPQVPILALTGTATPAVEKDIIKLLKLNKPLQIRTGSDRPNLSYYVHQKSLPMTDLMSQLKPNGQINKDSVIIYCPTRKDTEQLADLLANQGISAKAYHAGLSPDVRNEIHHEFLNQIVTCMVATVSFGMGIDKPDIRKVIHYGCPKDMESYLQETGRAGRDGKLSQCHVYFSQADFAINRFFLKDINDSSLRTHKEDMIHAMEKFLYITTCRRSFMLNYFGEVVTNTNSQCCDNCLTTHLSNKVEIGHEVKQFLTLLKDFSDKFGKLMYINVIRGANLQKMPAYLKKSIHFGIGQSLSLEWWKTCVQYLINADMITEKSMAGGYGSIIGLAPLGRQWLSTNQNQPTYIVTESEQIKSLAKIPKVKTRTGLTKVTSSPSTINNEKPSPLTNTLATTYQLFHYDKKTLQEIAETRKITASTIEGHIAECLKAKVPMDFSRLPLSKKIYNDILQVINQAPINGDTSKLAPIKNACSSNITYYQIKCALAINAADSSDQFDQTK